MKVVELSEQDHSYYDHTKILDRVTMVPHIVLHTAKHQKVNSDSSKTGVKLGKTVERKLLAKMILASTIHREVKKRQKLATFFKA